MSIDAIFSFIKEYFFQFLTIGALYVWFSLLPYGMLFLPPIRRVSLLIFTAGSLCYLKKVVNPLISAVDKINLDNLIRQLWAEYKGTDWVDGFLWGIAFSIYLAFIAWLWLKETAIGQKGSKG
jgi:branched-subunit amino acid ABC-type transport system permease component